MLAPRAAKSAIASSSGVLPTTLELIFNQRIVDRVPTLVSSDIRQVLAEHLRTNLPVRALGGGHGYLGNALAHGGLVIDLRPYRKVAVDRQNKQLRAQAGARFIDIYRALADEDGNLPLVLPTGDCPTVGIAGYTLGGGYGHLSRRFGLMCDNVVAMTVLLVDQQDQIVEKQLSLSSTDDDAELFWALRGGGGARFGIVTDFTFQLHDKPSDLRIYDLRLRGDLPPQDLAAAMRLWHQWLVPLIDDSTLSSKLAVGGDWFHLSGLHSDLNKIQALAEHLQPYLLADACHLDLAFNVANQAATFKQCASLAACEQQPKRPFAGRSAYLNLEQLPQAFADLADGIKQRRDHYSTYGGIELMSWRLKGGLNADNAFQHRHHDLLLQVYTEGYTDEREAWMQHMFTTATGRADNDASLPGYQNYLDASIADAELGFPSAYFPDPEGDQAFASGGRVIGRLQRIKDRYRNIHI